MDCQESGNTDRGVQATASAKATQLRTVATEPSASSRAAWLNDCGFGISHSNLAVATARPTPTIAVKIPKAPNASGPYKRLNKGAAANSITWASTFAVIACRKFLAYLDVHVRWNQ